MKRSVRTLAVAASAVVLSSAFVTPAHAVTVGTCTGKAAVTFTPGLRFSGPVMSTVGLNGTVSACTGSLPRSGKIRGSATSLAPGLTCTSGSATGRVTVTWVDGTVDKVRVTASTTGGITGKVTAGPRLGATIKLAGNVTPVTGDCILTPLTKASVAGTVTVSR